METQTERVVQADEGDGQPAAAEAVTSEQPTGAGAVSDQPTAPEGYEGVAPELWPDKDGKPPKLTEALMRQLRGKYFTVKLPRLENCGHKYSPTNEPRMRNCENCWFQFFNTHPQLVETADQFWRTQGKQAMVGMRGEHFTKMFVRYMATVIHMMQEEKALNVSRDKERIDGGSVNSGTEGLEAGASTSGVVEGREVVSDSGSSERTE